MMKKEKELLVAIASQKGGVGKSVFTVLLASVLHYRKGLRVAVVDCDYPQHSIALMRERDMESVMKNDDLKVSLYRQHERIRKPAYPVIKSDPEKAVEDLRRYMDEKGETFDIVLFDLPGTLRSEGVVYTVAAMDYIFVPLKADNIVMQSSLQFTKAAGRGAGRQEELQPERDPGCSGTWWTGGDGRTCMMPGTGSSTGWGCGCCPHTFRTPSATTGRRTLSARVSSVPRCFHPIPIRRKAPAFLNWWRRYAVPSAWRNPIPTGSGCQGIDTLNKDF